MFCIRFKRGCQSASAKELLSHRVMCFKNSGGHGKDTLTGGGRFGSNVNGSIFIILDQVRPHTNTEAVGIHG